MQRENKIRVTPFSVGTIYQIPTTLSILEDETRGRKNVQKDIIALCIKFKHLTQNKGHKRLKKSSTRVSNRGSHCGLKSCASLELADLW